MTIHVRAGITDLLTVNPGLAAQWHSARNGDLRPTQVTVSSGRKVWWLCAEGHEWAAPICRRSQGRGCPVCAGKVAVPGVNDLATLNPTLAAEWNPAKNGDLLPSQVTAGSGKKVWWLCGACGHEWAAAISNRSRGRGCPVCKNRATTRQWTGLGSMEPALAAQWHPALNDGLTPAEVTRYSSKKVWWLCPDCGREWQASVANRSRGTGCPARHRPPQTV